MNTSTHFNYISPPGDTLLETIESKSMSQSELAERMGRPEKTISAIINGKSAIKPDTALQLESVLGIPARFWLAREQNYQEAIARKQHQNKMSTQLEWLKELPIRAMKKYGWIENTRDKQTLLEQCLTFFSVASPDQWRDIWVRKEQAVSFKISLAFTNEQGAIATWIRHGELESSIMECPEYSKQKFVEALHMIRHDIVQMEDGFQEELRDLCHQAGVKLIYTPMIPKANICGVARWYSGSPIIQLSGRYKTNDHFWFTFFHEAAHILFHGKKDIFLEGLDNSPTNEEKENQANTFAEEILIPRKEYELFALYGNFKQDDITSFAREQRLHSGIIVGRLQRDKFIKYSWHSDLKKSINLVYK